MTKSEINKALSELRDDVEAHYAYLGLFAGQGMARSLMSGIISRLDTLIEQQPLIEQSVNPSQLDLPL